MDTSRRTCNRAAMRWILKCAFAAVVFACVWPAAAAEQAVIVNGVQLPSSAVVALQLAYRTIIPSGRYWYDAASGLWGREGQPLAGQMHAGLQIGGSLKTIRVHDRKHTFGRLRATGVSFDDRQDLLGHESGRITSHYSQAELGNLIAVAENVCDTESRKRTATSSSKWSHVRWRALGEKVRTL